ncbi:MAG: SGNH/GDSL hydrolase family protein [Rhodopila sp.]|nr:SGNH/GDSL hydrolase family protein [Rhodopila sp.]
MANLKSLIDGFDAATTVPPIPTAALGTAVSPSFIGNDAITVPAGGFSAIYAFGDSLSDAGNASIGTLGTVPVAGIYSGGRFTNGNVWVQDLAQNLGLPPVKPSLAGGTDYAYGGAETGATPVHAANPTDLPSQLGQFVASVPHPSATALYTVWAGSNDVLGIANSTETPAQQQASVQQAVTNETNFIDGLIAHGAKDLVVMGVPDLGKTPYEMARPASDATSSALAQEYNTDLGAALQQIMVSGAASIDYVNTFGLMDMAIANPGAYGLTNVTQPVWTGNLTNSHSGVLNATGAAQKGYLFFDDLHPTASGHALLADGVTQLLTGNA